MVVKITAVSMCTHTRKVSWFVVISRASTTKMPELGIYKCIKSRSKGYVRRVFLRRDQRTEVLSISRYCRFVVESAP